jgi:hypothetical protein
MDSTQAASMGPRVAARRMPRPALALAALLFLAAGALLGAAEPARAAPSHSAVIPVSAAAAVPEDRRAGPPPSGGLSATEDDGDGAAGEPPTRVRIAILNATGKPGGANKVALLLSEVKRRALEDQIGLQLEVVNLSTADSVRPGQSVLFYRPVFLRAALAMARAIPGEQLVQPMRPAGLKRAGVDVEIVVGEDLP